MSFFRKKSSRLDGISDSLWSKESDPATSFRLSTLSGGAGGRPVSRSRRMFHYIAAGGLRQTRARREAASPEIAGRVFVLKLFLSLAAFWLLFRFW